MKLTTVFTKIFEHLI